MTSYEVGKLSSLMSSGSPVPGKQKKFKKLQLLFSTPLCNHEKNINKSEKDLVKDIKFDSVISPIEVKKKIKRKKTKVITEKKTQEDDTHLQKDSSSSEQNLDCKEKKTKKRKRDDSESNREIIKVDDTRNKRTIFVGNLPTSFDKEDLKCLFKQFGKIESARIRSAASPKASLPKKVAVIKQVYHPDVHSFNGFVVFETEQMACAALRLNGVKVEDHHLRVDIASRNQEHDHKRSVFVGNLPFDIQDDDLWDFFQECGEIRQVRIIRDKETRIGKGFGYVLFKTVDTAALALEKNGEKLKGRPLRISRSVKREKKLASNKLSNEAHQKLHVNKRYQGKHAKEKLRLKKNKKIVKNRLRFKKKKILAQKLQSGLTKVPKR